MLCNSNSAKHLSMRISKTISQTSAGNYMFKVNNRNIRTMCEICSKLTIRHQNDESNTQNQIPSRHLPVQS